MKQIQSLFIFFVLCLALFVFVLQGSMLAVSLPSPTTISSTTMNTFSPPSASLTADIEQFLDTIPPGFYAIATVDKLKQQLADNKTLLIDVRETQEYQVGNIPQAINIPLRTLTQHLDQIPGDRPVVLYCSGGLSSSNGSHDFKYVGLRQYSRFSAEFYGLEKCRRGDRPIVVKKS